MFTIEKMAVIFGVNTPFKVEIVDCKVFFYDEQLRLQVTNSPPAMMYKTPGIYDYEIKETGHAVAGKSGLKLSEILPKTEEPVKPTEIRIIPENTALSQGLGIIINTLLKDIGFGDVQLDGVKRLSIGIPALLDMLRSLKETHTQTNCYDGPISIVSKEEKLKNSGISGISLKSPDVSVLLQNASVKRTSQESNSDKSVCYPWWGIYDIAKIWNNPNPLKNNECEEVFKPKQYSLNDILLNIPETELHLSNKDNFLKALRESVSNNSDARKVILVKTLYQDPSGVDPKAPVTTNTAEESLGDAIPQEVIKYIRSNVERVLKGRSVEFIEEITAHEIKQYLAVTTPNKDVSQEPEVDKDLSAREKDFSAGQPFTVSELYELFDKGYLSGFKYEQASFENAFKIALYKAERIVDDVVGKFLTNGRFTDMTVRCDYIKTDNSLKLVFKKELSEQNSLYLDFVFKYVDNKPVIYSVEVTCYSKGNRYSFMPKHLGLAQSELRIIEKFPLNFFKK